MVRGDSEVVTEPEFPEQFRSYSENEKHWQARRAFILRNAPLEGGEAPTPMRLDQLLSLSMVWANHLFLGCRYRLLVSSLARPPDGLGRRARPPRAHPGKIEVAVQCTRETLDWGKEWAGSRRPAVFFIQRMRRDCPVFSYRPFFLEITS